LAILTTYTHEFCECKLLIIMSSTEENYSYSTAVRSRFYSMRPSPHQKWVGRSARPESLATMRVGLRWVGRSDVSDSKSRCAARSGGSVGRTAPTQIFLALRAARGSVGRTGDFMTFMRGLTPRCGLQNGALRLYEYCSCEKVRLKDVNRRSDPRSAVTPGQSGSVGRHGPTHKICAALRAAGRSVGSFRPSIFLAALRAAGRSVGPDRLKTASKRNPWVGRSGTHRVESTSHRLFDRGWLAYPFGSFLFRQVASGAAPSRRSLAFASVTVREAAT
jgi:hypothetical protein